MSCNSGVRGRFWNTQKLRAYTYLKRLWGWKLLERRLDRRSIVIGAYAAMNDKEKAVACLQNAYRERANAITQMKVDPIYDPLRSDPRFQDLLRRVGLAQ